MACVLFLSAGYSTLTDGLTNGYISYGWDAPNRMTSLNNGSVATSYNYRADGMRVLKSNSSGSTVYRYDGQMGMQDVELNSSGVVQKVTNFALGARGVDAMSVTSGGSTSVSYPLYDAHGNMISTLAKNGTGYTYSAVRTFDAWGNLRLGAATGDPKGRYCANLGHQQDDESGLVYMRARYYEPTSGRFVSQDQSGQGRNWFAYASNDPVNAVDKTGKEAIAAIIGAIMGAIIGGITASMQGDNVFAGALIGGVTGALGGLTMNAALAGFVSAFLSSILADVNHLGWACLRSGSTWGKALAAGAVGAGTSIIFSGLSKALSKSFGAQVESLFGNTDENELEGAAGAMTGVFTGSLFSFATN